jgi:YesN/AraC family two-component response regulator
MFRDAAITVGCVEYLTKPIDLDELEALLVRLLGYQPVTAKSVQQKA